MRSRWLLGLAVVLVGACGGSAAPSASTAPPVPATPSVAATPTPSPITVGGDRPVTVHVPPGYDPSRPAPLLINLHGYSSNAREHDAYFGLKDDAAERGYLYIVPDGTRDDEGNQFWSGTDACCDFDKSGQDDVAYLMSIIDEIGSKFAVDPKRIYVAGHSNGGFMSYALACAHPETIAAMASLAGANYAKESDCAADAPVAVLQVHGTADDTILYDGGSLDLGPGMKTGPFPGAIASVATWAEIDGCDASPTTVDGRLDLDGSADAETVVTRWIGCQRGGAAELWSITNGSHAPDLTDTFATGILDFFDAHPKP